jgi:Fe(3+) dicitrate transport protein
VATVGDTTLDGGAIYLRASYGARDREFAKIGLESRLIGDHTLFGRRADTHVGARIHREKMIDERNNRATLHSPAVTAARDVRTVDALALFGQERVDVTSRLTLSAGLRVEAYQMERAQEVLGGVSVDDSGTSDNLEWIPGAGFTYELGECHTLFGGVHRGFAPPRTAQAITSDGEDLDLDAERSWNWELGVRGKAFGWLDYEATGFWYEFQNQVVPDNESGGSSTEDTNAGETRHFGFETLVSADMGRALWNHCDPCRTGLFFDVGYTFVDTENVTPGGLYEGNELPYAPRHVAFGTLRAVFRSRLSVAATGHFVSDQFSDQANTHDASNDGRQGIVPEHFTLDLKVDWRVPGSPLSLTGAVRNVFDETYIASRAPEGVFPGLPRHFFLGVEADF